MYDMRRCACFPIITRYTTKINNAGTTHAPQPTNASSALFTHIPNVPAASNNESAKTTENANTITAQIDARASSESHDILSSLCSDFFLSLSNDMPIVYRISLPESITKTPLRLQGCGLYKKFYYSAIPVGVALSKSLLRRAASADVATSFSNRPPLYPVPAGINRPIITFSFNPF